ncbi:MAG: CARDB domain-containing protein, partial [Bacteroidota bacterium]
QSGDFFPIGSTTVTFTATDLAGNTASCSFTVTVSEENIGDGPTVSLSTASTVVDGPFSVSVSFSENVTDFTLAEIQVTNGTKSNPAQQSGSQYSFTITPTEPGEVTVFVPADVAFDQDGNGNQASEVLSVQFGNIVDEQPDLIITSIEAPASAVLGELIAFTVRFKNQGTETAAPARLSFFVTTDGTPPISGSVGSNTFLMEEPLAAGEERIRNFNIRSNMIAEPGAYFIAGEIDSDEEVMETNEDNNFFFEPITLRSDNTGDGLDLELSATASNNNPTIYSFFSISLTLRNNGDVPATQARVNIPSTAGAVLKGGDEFELTGGTVMGSFWEVNNLMPGESETLTINYFNLSETEKIYFTQVTQQTPDDTDSTPNNGSFPTPSLMEKSGLSNVCAPKLKVPTKVPFA